MKSWQSVSLPAWLKGLNVEVILISRFMDSEIRIALTLRYFCQAGRLTDCQDFISKNFFRVLYIFIHYMLGIKKNINACFLFNMFLCH